MNKIKGNVPLPIVLQVTQVPLGLYGQTDGPNRDKGPFLLSFSFV
jgi:hypothetical protein